MDEPEDANPLLRTARIIAETAAYDPHHLSSAEIAILVRSVREMADRLEQSAVHDVAAHGQGQCSLCMLVRWLMAGCPLRPETPGEPGT